MLSNLKRRINLKSIHFYDIVAFCYVALNLIAMIPMFLADDSHCSDDILDYQCRNDAVNNVFSNYPNIQMICTIAGIIIIAVPIVGIVMAIFYVLFGLSK